MAVQHFSLMTNNLLELQVYYAMFLIIKAKIGFGYSENKMVNFQILVVKQIYLINHLLTQPLEKQ